MAMHAPQASADPRHKKALIQLFHEHELRMQALSEMIISSVLVRLPG